MKTEEKRKILERLVQETGLSAMRCKSFLERCGYDYDKVREIPQIKSALVREEPLWDETPAPSPQPQSPPKAQEKKTAKSTKRKTETPKPKKPIPPKAEIEEKAAEDVNDTAASPSPRKSRKKKKGNLDELLQKTKKRQRGGITYEVEIVNGKEYFRGKEIRSDNNCFYHPYPTMREITDWTNKFVRRTGSRKV